jgi:hypothetical protein
MLLRPRTARACSHPPHTHAHLAAEEVRRLKGTLVEQQRTQRTRIRLLVSAQRRRRRRRRWAQRRLAHRARTHHGPRRRAAAAEAARGGGVEKRCIVARHHGDAAAAIVRAAAPRVVVHGARGRTWQRGGLTHECVCPSVVVVLRYCGLYVQASFMAVSPPEMPTHNCGPLATPPHGRRQSINAGRSANGTIRRCPQANPASPPSVSAPAHLPHACSVPGRDDHRWSQAPRRVGCSAAPHGFSVQRRVGTTQWAQLPANPQQVLDNSVTQEGGGYPPLRSIVIPQLR